MEITEALRLQLDVQRSLLEQLEVCYLFFLPEVSQWLKTFFCRSSSSFSSAFTWVNRFRKYLQMRIEAQGKKLQQMFEQQLKANINLVEPLNFDILLSDEQPITLDGDLSFEQYKRTD